MKELVPFSCYFGARSLLTTLLTSSVSNLTSGRETKSIRTL